MTDSDPSDSELYAVMVNQDLYYGSVWGSDAAHKGLKKHFSGRDAVRERVDAVPVEALEELVERMQDDPSPPAQRWSERLQEIIDSYE